MNALRSEVEDGTEEVEDLESFRHRARAFIRSNLRQMAAGEVRYGPRPT